MYIFVDFEVKVTQSCPTLCNPTDYIDHGILPVRILEWVAFPFSGRYSQPRDQTQVSRICGIQRYVHTCIHICRQTKAMMKKSLLKDQPRIILFICRFEKGKQNMLQCKMEGIRVLVFVVGRNKTSFPWVLYYSSFSFGPSLLLSK